MAGAAPLVGVLLAAGKGSRFGGDKLLHPLPDGRPLALAAAAHLRPACDRLIAVLRPENERLAGLLQALDCVAVYCADAERGMGRSLAAGVAATPGAAGWLVALADMPYIAASTHHAVAVCLRAGASLVASEYQGQRGHPVGFAGRWFEDLVALDGDQGGRAILQANDRELVLCPVDDPGVRRDIDRPEDLEPGFRSWPGS